MFGKLKMYLLVCFVILRYKVTFEKVITVKLNYTNQTTLRTESSKLNIWKYEEEHKEEEHKVVMA